MRKFYLFFPQFLICITACHFVIAQTTADTTGTFQKIIPAPEYEAGGFKRWLWGNNYRDEWTIPATIRVLNLDSTAADFKIVSTGINNDLLNLHVQDATGKEYLIRPVDKHLGKILPELFRKTFVEQRLTDGGSASNPYAGAPIPILAKAAGVYSANITYRYVPSQPMLGEYNNVFGNKFFVFEELVPGNFESCITTVTLLDTLNSNTHISIDEKALIKARLFDMFLNDWNRPEQNWLWGKTKSGDKTVYIPLPVNRDQALSNYDGLLFGAGLGIGRLNYFQKFKDDILSVKFINQREKDLDRRLLNQTNLEDWISIAKDLQQSLTDDVIEMAVKQFPPEMYAARGNEIKAKLTARRRHIAEWASEYYHFLFKEVQVTGTSHNDRFDVQRTNNNEVHLQVFEAGNHSPYYSKTFKSSETKEIRLFGLNGNDTYHISGAAKNNIRIKISDGINDDSVVDVSGKKNKVTVYAKDGVKTNGANNIHINHDTTYRSYDYHWFKYNRRGISPIIFFSLEDRLFAGLSYNILSNKWDKRPFASVQNLSLHYSIMEKAPSITYKALFPKLVLKSNLSLLANYDHVRWQFYYGLGNKTTHEGIRKLKYYTTRTRQWAFRPQLTKYFGNSTISAFASAQGIKIIDDTARFIAKPGMNTTDFKWQTYAGGGLSYSYELLNDAIVPTKGFYINASAMGEQNVNDRSSHYMKYSSNAYVYIPLTSKFSLNLRAGVSTVTGNPEFYQYPSIGGVIFRGVPADRFRGKTAFYNTNDLRFISPFHSWFFNGKAGFLVFCDDGRVWLPGEKSNRLHIAYGAGLIVAPFNLIYLDATFGFYKNENTLQVRATFPLPK